MTIGKLVTRVSVAVLFAVGAIMPVPATAATAAPYCGITWGSLAKNSGALSTAPLVQTRTGRHDCWDRLVFEFNGSATGYRVRYASEVYTEGAGQPMSGHTAGGALLEVQLLAPAYNSANQSTYPYTTLDHVANVNGYSTLRDVVYGGSFEGYTTFAVGVRARLPMRVFTLTGPGSHSRIVLDIAHQW